MLDTDLQDWALYTLVVLRNKGVEYLRHPHGKTFDHNVGVERLENILGEQAVIHTRVLVLLELWQLVLTDIHHDGRLSGELGKGHSLLKLSRLNRWNTILKACCWVCGSVARAWNDVFPLQMSPPRCPTCTWYSPDFTSHNNSATE
jgi:hypothetical protein